MEARDAYILCDEEPWKGDPFEVVGTSLAPVPFNGSFTGPRFAIIFGGSGGGAPSPPAQQFPESCNTGVEEIDGNEAHLSSVWENSYPDSELSLEQAALLWPNDEGGYDLLEYSIDILGGGPGPCQFVSPPPESFPSPNEWPDGVIHIHSHPYSQFSYDDACPQGYSFGPSNSDRNHIQWLRDTFGKSDIVGIVIDGDMIFRYGVDAQEDSPPHQRCGY